jgi:hypothetical protein
MPEESAIPFGLTEDQLIRLSWIMAAFFFGMAILGVVGEVLGWWNDIGEILVTVGTLAGVAVTIGVAYYGAGRNQVNAVRQTVEDNNEVLQDNNELLQDNNQVLHDNNEILKESNDKLDQLEKLDQLDRQVELLQGIRDRL